MTGFQLIQKLENQKQFNFFRGAFAIFLRIPEKDIKEIWKANQKQLYLLNIQPEDGSLASIQPIWTDMTMGVTGNEQYIKSDPIRAYGPFILEEDGHIFELFQSLKWKVEVVPTFGDEIEHFIINPREKMIFVYPSLQEQDVEFVKNVNNFSLSFGLGGQYWLTNAWKLHGVTHGLNGFSNDEMYLLVVKTNRGYIEIHVASVNSKSQATMHMKLSARKTKDSPSIFSNGSIMIAGKAVRFKDHEKNGFEFERIE